MLELASSQLRLVVRPEIGAAVARFDWIGRAEPAPLFRPWDGRSDDPNRHACYPLLPWSNRISGGGIKVGDRFWPLTPNVPGEPYPIHGNGWQRPWSVAERSYARVRLSLDSCEQAPFDYRAELTYELINATLSISLSVEHRAATPTPYGLGFHPWLPRTRKTTLRAAATTVWLETADHLPAGAGEPSDRPLWDFSRQRPLSSAWINNGFSGWDGHATIDWPELGASLQIGADPPLSTYVLYSPSADADFFCFEPVAHPVDAFHHPGLPGLRVLAQGERLAKTCRFTVRDRTP
jgi:aldose 1-epimerase